MISQALTACLLVGAALGFGMWPAHWLTRALDLAPATTAALVPATGLTIMGCSTLVLGALSLVSTTATLILCATGLAVGLLRLRHGDELIRAGRWLGAEFHDHNVLGVITCGYVALIAVATLGRPQAADEIAYHWPAALDWAARGSFGASPFRHVDGSPFMEILFTLGATLESPTAAHALHLLTTVILVLSVLGLAQSLGIAAGLPLMAAVIAIPVVANESYIAYNDVAAAAFGILAFALVLSGARVRARQLLWGGAALGVAVSIKPIGAGAAIALGTALILSSLLHERRLKWRLVARILVLAVIPATVAALWLTRRYVLTGSILDPVVFGEQSADALSRQPDLLDKIVLPIMPLFLGVIGQLEPWGGRIGFVLAVFLPVAIVIAFRHDGRSARILLVLGVAAYVPWLLLGYAIPPRTRFHIGAWCLLLIAVWAVLDEHLARPATVWAWTGLVVLGYLDNSIEMMRTGIANIDPALLTGRSEVIGPTLTMTLLTIVASTVLVRLRILRSRQEHERLPLQPSG